MIFSYLFNKLLPYEPKISKEEATAIASHLAKLHKTRLGLKFDNRDIYNEAKKLLTSSLSRPAFFHELGHFVQHRSLPGRILERIGNIGNFLADESTLLSVLSYPLLRYRLKPSSALKATLGVALTPSILATLPEASANIAAIPYTPLKYRGELLKYNILPALTYMEPAIPAVLSGLLTRHLVERLIKTRIR